MYTINLRPTVGQVSESSRPPRVNTSSDPSSDPSHNPNVPSAIPIPEESRNVLNLTSRLGESQTTREPTRFSQNNISYVNLDES